MCAVLVIWWGAKMSSDKLRHCARCSACGHKGATQSQSGVFGDVRGGQTGRRFSGSGSEVN
jgi:hypothetical protein